MLCKLLGVQRGLTAVIGSGGKTTLLHRLAQELSAQGRVILTTTTHILPSAQFPNLVQPTQAEIAAALAQAPVVCIGNHAEHGKLCACDLPFSTLLTLADYVLVEADGSKWLPLKAHAAYEPVIPPETKRTVCVVGAEGFDRPICEVVHRPEIFCKLTGATIDAPATPALVAKVLAAEHLADIYYVNQCECPDRRRMAERLAQELPKPVLIGSLLNES